mgnify:CR=1 FL=1
MSSIHASAVLVGDRAILIRGRSGTGKSRLSFDLILAGRSGQIAKTVLIGDDRVEVATTPQGLVVSPAEPLAGLIEIRGLGVRRCDFAAQAVVGLVVDLAAADAERLPQPAALRTTIAGIELPRLPIAADFDALPVVVAALTTAEVTA